VTQQLITTTPANTQRGDSPKAAFDKVNANFTELYGNAPGGVTFGSVVVGSPAGGNEGIGSLNAQTIFINGVAVVAGVGAGGVSSITGTANQIAASASTGGVTLSFSPNVVVPAPASGTSVTINAIDQATTSYNTAGSNTLAVSSVGSTANSGGAVVFGTNSGAWSWAAIKGLAVNGSSNTTGDLQISTRRVATDSTLTEAMRIAGAGNVSIAAPSSGVGLTVSGAASSFATDIFGGGGIGANIGMRITAGSTTADSLLTLRNASQTANYWTFVGDGSQVSSGNTPQGLGTINAAGLFVTGVPVRPSLSGTTAAIGGGALLAGQVAQGTVTIAGATTSMVATASPSSDPDSNLSTGIAIYAFVSSANTVTVRVCAIVAVTPAAVTYNVRVIQ